LTGVTVVGKIIDMASLIPKIESQLASLPVPIALQLPDGRTVSQPGSRVTLAFTDWTSLAKLAARQVGAIGEAYVEGRVQIEGAMRDLTDAAAGLLPGNPAETDTSWWSRMMRRAKSRGSHTLGKDAAQIEFHYDVSDDFYALWLDPRRVYSCAYYREPGMTLAAAQEAKLDHICRKLGLREGERFLDIGAGWGGLLMWAAEHYGVRGHGITLSKNQHAHVNQLIEARGLHGRVTMELLDYRELPEREPYDKIASIGMFEHVGRALMPAYFAKIYRLLKPGGLLMNHGITAGGTRNHQLGAGMGEFIDRYIFPGGELMHVSKVTEVMSEAQLEPLDLENLRPHYARTLWAWSDALEAQLRKARALTRESVVRAYRVYLAGSAMGFEQGWMALFQMLAARPSGHVADGPMPGAQSQYPFNRAYMYPR
jgi:cyclopropane-fatty-acyl-phospholipid synthase